MLKITRIIVITCLIFISCFAISCSTQKSAGELELLTYTSDTITFEYPNWPDIPSQEEEIFLLKSDGSSVFSAARYPVPSTLLIRELENNLDASFDGEYGYYLLSSEGSKLNAITRVIYSDYQSYALTIASIDQPDKGLLLSAKAKARELTTKASTGLMPIPLNGDAAFLSQACRDARDLGAEVISWYFFWGGLEDDWAVADYIMECLSHEGKSVVVMNVIHTNVLGRYPPQFSSFVDPGFKEAFAEFSVEFVKRYQPDYYFIGGEVDIYLNLHRDEIPAFKEVLSYTYHEIKEASPETQVGLVVTYHYARDNDALDIIKTLAPESDLLGYTVHPYEGDFLYSNVSRGLMYLNEVKDVVPSKPYAIIETGWSSSTLLDSSEDIQAEFVHDYFSFVDNSNAEFVIWFSLHDQGDCSEAAKVHLEATPHLQLNEDYIRAFEEFMCSPGLKYTDSIPKKAWDIWMQYVN